MKEVKYKRIHKVQLVLMQEEGNSESINSGFSADMGGESVFATLNSVRRHLASAEKACIRTGEILRMNRKRMLYGFKPSSYRIICVGAADRLPIFNNDFVLISYVFRDKSAAFPQR